MERKIKKGFLIFFTSAFALLLLSPMAAGADFCVSTAEDLQSALTTAASNGQDDVIKIVQGLYKGNFAFSSGENYGLNIEGGYEVGCSSRTMPPGKTTLDAGGNGKALSIQSSSALNFIVDGLTLQNATNSGIFVYIGGNFFLSNSIIQNNSSPGGGGANLAAKKIELINNSFFYNAAGVGGALNIGADVADTEEINLINNLISHNTANVAEGGGIHIKWGSPSVTLINNVISHNATIRNVSGGHGGGAHISTYGPVNFINNTVVGNSTVLTGGWGAGTTIYYASSANVYNNIFWANEGQPGRDIAFYSIDPAAVAILANNIDQSPSGISGLGNYPYDPSNINGDPLFLSPTNEDYHLQATSPCINAGNNGAPELPTTDKDGLARIVNATVDMGAYEYQGTIAPIAPDLLGELKEFHYYKFKERVVIELDIENRGTNAGPFNVAFYLSQNGVTLGELVYEEFLKKGLRASRSTSVKGNYVSPTPLSGKYIIAVIDSADQVAESIETNNRVVIRVP